MITDPSGEGGIGRGHGGAATGRAGGEALSIFCATAPGGDIHGVKWCTAPGDKVKAAGGLEGRLTGALASEVAHYFGHGTDAGSEWDARGVTEWLAGDAFKEFC